MILKVTPKEALKTIDALLVEAVALRRDFNEEYWTSASEKVEELLRDPDKLVGTAELRVGLLASLVERLDAFKKKTAQQLINICEEIATPALFLALERKVDTTNITKIDDRHYFYAEKNVDLCIDFLELKHQELVEGIKSPLQYLQEKAQILYFDAVCQLTPNSNEADLCNLMFDLSIGEFRGMDEVYEYMNGEQNKAFPAGWQKKVRNAIDGVNEKTKERFGFAIFSIKKNMAGLVVPSQLIASYR